MFLLPTNQVSTNILGRTDFEFDNLYDLFSGFPLFRFPGSQNSKNPYFRTGMYVFFVTIFRGGPTALHISCEQHPP